MGGLGSISQPSLLTAERNPCARLLMCHLGSLVLAPLRSTVCFEGRYSSASMFFWTVASHPGSALKSSLDCSACAAEMEMSSAQKIIEQTPRNLRCGGDDVVTLQRPFIFLLVSRKRY